MKKNNLFEYAMLDKAHPKIQSAKHFIPEWYKNTKNPNTSFKEIKHLPVDVNFKMCSPFLEALTLGYIASLSIDIAVKQTENGPVITWNDNNKQYMFVRYNELDKNLPTPNGFSKNHYTWITQHMIKIPKGYSALFTHPFNRYDLPFLTMSGVVDGEFVLPHGNLPVFISNTFEGVIQAGTPIVQILLFKTENWKLQENQKIIEEGFLNQQKSDNAVFGWYKKHIWKKKQYD